MNRIFKPASLLLYLLAGIFFCLLGMTVAGLTGAAKGQGLAGGAIVLSYGILAGLAALVLALIFAQQAQRSQVLLVNKILAAALLLLAGALAFRNFQKNSANTGIIRQEQPSGKALLAKQEAGTFPPENQKDQPMGLGFFTPEFYEHRVFYFYGHPNLEKSIQEHSPTDSIVFQRTEHGFEITYAPPWLAPAHMKLDYDMLYFQLQSVGREFARIIVNEFNGQTAYINRFSGKIMYWPEFLLSIHSVELLDKNTQTIHIKPLAYASLIKQEHAFLRPVLIEAEWMLVDLWDNNFKKTGKGWIRWRKEGRLLISYSLLS